MDAATEPPTGAASTRAEELDARSQYIAHLHATVVPAGLDLRAARKRPLWQESNEILEARTTASRARLLWALGVRADITADDLVVCGITPAPRRRTGSPQKAASAAARGPPSWSSTARTPGLRTAATSTAGTTPLCW